jgi:pre-mRNA-processing factor 17
MDLLRQYSGSDDDGEPRLAHNGSHAQEPPSTSGRTLEDDREASPELLVLPSKSSAPVVSSTLVVRHQTGSADPGLRVIDPTKKSVSYNPTIDQLYAPVVGPAHPYAKDGLAHGARNHKQGVVEDAFIAPFNFDEQYNTYQTFGYAADPSAANGTLVGDQKMMESYEGATVYNLAPREQKKRKLEAAAARGEEEGGEEAGNVASETWLKAKSPWAGKKEYVQPELTVSPLLLCLLLFQRRRVTCSLLPVSKIPRAIWFSACNPAGL